MGAKPAATTTSPRSPGGGASDKASDLLSFPPASDVTKGAQRADLSEEEFSKLIELVSQQEEGLKLGIETPYSLLTQITVRVGSASAVLFGIDGGTVLRGSLEGISAAADFFPVTRRIQLGVTAMGVESPEGVFLQTGAEEILGEQGQHVEIDRAGEEERKGFYFFYFLNLTPLLIIYQLQSHSSNSLFFLKLQVLLWVRCGLLPLTKPLLSLSFNAPKTTALISSWTLFLPQATSTTALPL